MSDLDAILARARAPGPLSERRHFTLSRAQAIEKLRDFALRRPGQAVLELVQGAVFAGATYIAVDTHPDRLVVAWVGTPALEADQLEHLFDYLFADRGTRGQRHLVQLAVAVNAMLRVDRARVRVESGSGAAGDTLRLDLKADGTGVVGRPETTLAGTYVAMERPRPWWRFWDRGVVTEEQVLVEEQCRYTPVPILLNGSAPFGYRASRRIRAFHPGEDVVFDEGPGGRRGSLYLTPHESRVDVVIGGVRVTTLALPELGVVQSSRFGGGVPHCVSGVICDDDLRKTADQSDVVRDDRFAALLEALRDPTTELARRQVPRWACPLPRPHPTGPGPDDDALPVRLEQLAPRPPISLDTVASWAVEVPLFWVEPADARTAPVRTAADPLRLPLPVFVLTRAQATRLEATLGRPVAHLADAAAVDLAVRVAAGAHGLTRLDPGSVDRAGRSWSGQLGPRFTGTGLTAQAGLPVLVRADRRTLAIHVAHLDAPGLVAEVSAPVPDVVSPDTLRTQVLHHLAAPALADPELPRALRIHLLAAVVRVEPSAAGVLKLGLPSGWGLPDLPLDLDELAAAVSAGGRLCVPDADLAALAPLADVVGGGTIGTTPHGQPRVGVHRRDAAWEPAAAFDPSVPGVWVWSGPPTAGATIHPDAPFLTGHHLPDGELASAAAALLPALDAAAVRSAVSPDLAAQAREALARRLDRSDWSRIDDPRPLRIHGGPRTGPGPHRTLSWSLARAAGRLGELALPAWVDTASISGGWLVHVELPGGWLAIPRDRSPAELAPRVLVDTGLDRTWVSTRTLLPCVGVLRQAEWSDATLWPALVAVWLALLDTPTSPAAAAWVALAQHAVPPHSLLGARLAAWSAGQPKAAGSGDRAAAAVGALDRVERQEADPERLLAGQRRVLRALLGERSGRVTAPSAEAETSAEGRVREPEAPHPPPPPGPRTTAEPPTDGEH